MAIKLKNVDAHAPRRVRLIPRNPESQFTPVDGTNTDWFVRMDDGSIGFCIGPKNEISCDGAANSFILVMLLSDSIESSPEMPMPPDILDIYAATVVSVNGEVMNMNQPDSPFVEYFDIRSANLSDLDGFEVPEGYQVMDATRFYSRDPDNDIRVIYDLSANNPDNIIIVSGWGTPTVMNVEDDPRIIEVCVAPGVGYVEPTISCDGATETIVINVSVSMSDDTAFIEITLPNPDGTELVLLGGSGQEFTDPEAFLEYINTQGFKAEFIDTSTNSSRLTGELYLTNYTGSDVRLNIGLTFGDNDNLYIDEAKSTPTQLRVEEYPYYSVTKACLAPGELVVIECTPSGFYLPSGSNRNKLLPSGTYSPTFNYDGQSISIPITVDGQMLFSDFMNELIFQIRDQTGFPIRNTTESGLAAFTWNYVEGDSGVIEGFGGTADDTTPYEASINWGYPLSLYITRAEFGDAIILKSCRQKFIGISCAGATETVVLGTFTAGGYYNVTIDDNPIIEGIYGFYEGRPDGDLITNLEPYGIQVTPLNSSFEEVFPDSNGYYHDVEAARFRNLKDSEMRMVIEAGDANPIDTLLQQDTYGYNESVEFSNDGMRVQFCLSETTFECHCNGNQSFTFEIAPTFDTNINHSNNNPRLLVKTLGAPERTTIYLNEYTDVPYNSVADFIDWMFANNLGRVANSLDYEYSINESGNIELTIINKSRRCNDFSLEVAGSFAGGFNLGTTLCEATSTVISCMGATDSIMLELGGDYEITVQDSKSGNSYSIDWQASQNPFDIPSDTYSHLGIRIEGSEEGGYFKLTNLSLTDSKRWTIEHLDSYGPNLVDGQENTTFFNDPISDDLYYFCLSPSSYSPWFECVGATNSVVLGPMQSGGIYDVEINDVMTPNIYGFKATGDFRERISQDVLEITPLDINFNEVYPESNGTYIGVEYARFTNMTGENLRVRMIPSDASAIVDSYQKEIYGDNKAFVIEQRGFEVAMCLSANTDNNIKRRISLEPNTKMGIIMAFNTSVGDSTAKTATALINRVIDGVSSTDEFSYNYLKMSGGLQGFILDPDYSDDVVSSEELALLRLTPDSGWTATILSLENNTSGVVHYTFISDLDSAMRWAPTARDMMGGSNDEFILQPGEYAKLVRGYDDLATYKPGKYNALEISFPDGSVAKHDLTWVNYFDGGLFDTVKIYVDWAGGSIHDYLDLLGLTEDDISTGDWGVDILPVRNIGQQPVGLRFITDAPTDERISFEPYPEYIPLPEPVENWGGDTFNCSGALNYVDVGVYADMNQLGTPEGQALLGQISMGAKYILNGMLYKLKQEENLRLKPLGFILTTDSETATSAPLTHPNGFVPMGAFRLANVSNEDLRFEYLLEHEENLINVMVLDGNPTVSASSNMQKLSGCLKAAEFTNGEPTSTTITNESKDYGDTTARINWSIDGGEVRSLEKTMSFGTVTPLMALFEMIRYLPEVADYDYLTEGLLHNFWTAFYIPRFEGDMIDGLMQEHANSRGVEVTFYKDTSGFGGVDLFTELFGSDAESVTLYSGHNSQPGMQEVLGLDADGVSFTTNLANNEITFHGALLTPNTVVAKVGGLGDGESDMYFDFDELIRGTVNLGQEKVNAIGENVTLKFGSTYEYGPMTLIVNPNFTITAKRR